MNVINRLLRCLPITLIILARLDSISWCAQEGLCTGYNATLDCLKHNHDELYQEDYVRFYDILADAENKAFQGKDIRDTISFLELVDIESNNAEFNEYIAEIVPTLCVKNPTIFLDALSASRDKTFNEVMVILKEQVDVTVEEPNLYIDNALVSKVLSKYKNKKKYKKIMDIYFGKDKKLLK